MLRPLFWLNPITISGFLSACAYAYLSFQSQEYAEAGFIELWMVTGFCAALCFLTFFYYHKNTITVPLKSLLFWALCFRLIGITAFPILEDDFYRYLWDGRMMVESSSPYNHPPADFFADDNIDESFENILDRINYPDIATVYGPVCQWIFALAYMLAPGQEWPLQLIFGMLDFLLVLLLSRLAPAKWVLLYAWSPLVIKEFAFTAHTDILGIFFVFVAIMARQRFFLNLSAILLSLAVGSKIFAIILVPLLLGFNFRAWLSFFSGILLITLPFFSIDPWLPEGLGTMATQWLFNAPINSLLFTLLPAIWVKYIMLIVFAGLWCIYAWNFKFDDKQLIPRGDWLFAALFLCLPVVNAWYLVWLLPFAVIYPSRWSWTASITILLCYAVDLNPVKPLPMTVIVIEYTLILIALIHDLIKPIRN